MSYSFNISLENQCKHLRIILYLTENGVGQGQTSFLKLKKGERKKKLYKTVKTLKGVVGVLRSGGGSVTKIIVLQLTIDNPRLTINVPEP